MEITKGGGVICLPALEEMLKDKALAQVEKDLKRQKLAKTLHFYHKERGLSMTEIANTLGMCRKTVSKLIREAEESA